MQRSCWRRDAAKPRHPAVTPEEVHPIGVHFTQTAVGIDLTPEWKGRRSGTLRLPGQSVCNRSGGGPSVMLLANLVGVAPAQEIAVGDVSYCRGIAEPGSGAYGWEP